LSFKKIEDRLKTYLNKYLNKSGKIVVSKTHLQISKDLGTSREVVSRALKKIESEMNYEFHLKK
jgi:CRP/FNR family transcriptional regulator